MLERLCSSSRPLVRRFGIPAPAPRHRACERFSEAIRRNLPIGRDSRIFHEMTAQRAVAFFLQLCEASAGPRVAANARRTARERRSHAHFSIADRRFNVLFGFKLL
ncbi:hypothetical protein C6P96_23735 [Burkholderia multivorans]|nr:hypothetical protein C6P95_23930 [Burkholderia multivorans]PRF07558.1 hypothetical protein C6P96_23735 [Burkholderia multivorans]